MATVGDLINSNIFKVINRGDNINREISKIYTCDLLSIAMSKMPAGAAWVTVMGNINSLAVSSLTDGACIILAEGTSLDITSLERAKAEGITVLAYDGPVFDGALLVHKMING